LAKQRLGEFEVSGGDRFDDAAGKSAGFVYVRRRGIASRKHVKQGRRTGAEVVQLIRQRAGIMRKKYELSAGLQLAILRYL